MTQTKPPPETVTVHIGMIHGVSKDLEKALPILKNGTSSFA